MKKLPSLLALTLSIVTLTISSSVFSQEYDDMYFRKKDRVKTEAVATKSAQTDNKESFSENQEFNKSTNPDYLAQSDTSLNEDEVYFEEGYEPQTNSRTAQEYMDNADVVVKHYYYGSPSTTYYGSFDDVFWSDPFLYQGTVFDPFYDPFYRSNSFYRPGWNVSIRIGGGYPYYGNRWRYSSYYGYNNYYNYGWGGYYNSWNSYYDPFWCPPSYYNYNRNYIVVNTNESYYNNSRGVVRGKRSSRNSTYANANYGTRSGRIANNNSSGRISNGRISDDNGAIKTRGNGRSSSDATNSESNYSGFRRTDTNNTGYTSRESSRSGTNTSTQYSNSRSRSSNNVGKTEYNSGTSRNNSRSSYSNGSSNNATRSTNSNSSSQSRSTKSYSSSSRSSGSTNSGNISRSSNSRSSSGNTKSSSNSSSRRKKD